MAELYEKLKDYEKAYDYYKRVSQDIRISKQMKSNKIARLKMALYRLNYEPNTFLYNQIPQSFEFTTSSMNTTPEEAFSTLLNLANKENLPEAYNWIGK